MYMPDYGSVKVDLYFTTKKKHSSLWDILATKGPALQLVVTEGRLKLKYSAFHSSEVNIRDLDLQLISGSIYKLVST